MKLLVCNVKRHLLQTRLLLA